MTSTSDHNPDLKAHHPRWLKARTVVAGSAAVKAEGVAYLPLAFSGQTRAEYAAHKKRTLFLPMASYIHKSTVDLIFSIDPHLEAGEENSQLRVVLDALTPEGDSYLELSRSVTSEHYLTRFQLLVADQPPAQPGTSRAAAFELGLRPYVAQYTAENILDYAFGVVRNRQELVMAFVQDSKEQRRRLRLNNAGFYEVVVERLVDEQWVSDAPVVPRVKGKPLQSIPAVLVAGERCRKPEKTELDDLVELNLDHYAASGLVDAAKLHAATPITVITGVNPPGGDGDDGGDGQQGVAGPNSYNGHGESVGDGTSGSRRDGMSAEPGAIWYIGAPDAKVYYHEYQGQSMSHLIEGVKDIEDKVGELSGGFWPKEKSGVEATDTHRIRRSVQNARIASTANYLAGRLQTMFQIVSDWMDGPEVKFSLNTDYNSIPLTAQEITALLALRTAGEMSGESLFDALQQGDVFDRSLTYKMEEERRKADKERDAEKAAQSLETAVAAAEQATVQAEGQIAAGQ